MGYVIFTKRLSFKQRRKMNRRQLKKFYYSRYFSDRNIPEILLDVDYNDIIDRKVHLKDFPFNKSIFYVYEKETRKFVCIVCSKLAMNLRGVV